MAKTTVDLAARINVKFNAWRRDRRPHELQWFINAAYRKGLPNEASHAVRHEGQIGDQITSSLVRPRSSVNRLQAKQRARFAKFNRNRPTPLVVPFSSQRSDKLDAKASQRALDYYFGRNAMEEKYNDALLWAADCGKSFWWFHWDNNAMVPISQENDGGEATVIDKQLGDIVVEMGNAFEVLVADPKLSRLADQPEIMRVKVRELAELNIRYPKTERKDKRDLEGDIDHTQPFEFERQMTALSTKPLGSLANLSNETGIDDDKMTKAIVKEWFAAPTADFPQGRYVVVVGDVVVKEKEALPFGFFDLDNPYPVEEFQDIPQIGQFWTSTFTEALIPIQRAYDNLRNQLEEQIDLNIHPKWLVPKQAQIPDSAFSNIAAEVVEWNWIPGMPEPHALLPGNIAADAWRMANLLQVEMDDISQIQPPSEGKTSSAKSGFQTNLLQEASDAVHAPDARGYELAIEKSAIKIRRLMKNGYTQERLITFAGPHSSSQVAAFSSSQIDEHAAIKVQIGSALGGLKATQIQQMLDLYTTGLLGDPNDPETKRRTLTTLDLRGLEEAQERANIDEEQASEETTNMLADKEVPIPQFYENHAVHIATHTDELKSPGTNNLDDSSKLKIISHVILHINFTNPAAATQLVQQYGLEEQLFQEGLVTPTEPPQQAGGPPDQPPQPPAEGPPLIQ